LNEQITEFVNSGQADLRVDRELGVVRGVKILGLTSKNNRTYLHEALTRAIPLYEGARVNVDHPQGRADAPRSYQDRIGTVRRVRQREDGLYGDFFFNPKHNVAEQLVWDAEHAPENVGFSHNALARTSMKDGHTVVEEIVQVRSVDLVADPATTQGLFEHHDNPGSKAHVWDTRARRWKPYDFSPTEEESMNLSLESLQRDHPDLYEEIRHSVRQEIEQRAETHPSAELAQLREEKERLAKEQLLAQRQRAIDTMLEEARLPRPLRSKRFEQLCHSVDEESLVVELIQMRLEDRAWLESAAKPISVEQSPALANATAVYDGATFAAALR
jgi:hypothetical protein